MHGITPLDVTAFNRANVSIARLSISIQHQRLQGFATLRLLRLSRGARCLQLTHSFHKNSDGGREVFRLLHSPLKQDQAGPLRCYLHLAAEFGSITKECNYHFVCPRLIKLIDCCVCVYNSTLVYE